MLNSIPDGSNYLSLNVRERQIINTLEWVLKDKKINCEGNKFVYEDPYIISHGDKIKVGDRVKVKISGDGLVAGHLASVYREGIKVEESPFEWDIPYTIIKEIELIMVTGKEVTI
jgi:hypothetical protein